MVGHQRGLFGASAAATAREASETRETRETRETDEIKEGNRARSSGAVRTHVSDSEARLLTRFSARAKAARVGAWVCG